MSRITCLFMLATLVLAGGCGDDDVGGICEPGSKQVCDCLGGGTGEQTCNMAGEWWNCICPTCYTCQSLGKECGSWPDGCGGTINCGYCSSGVCDAGQCVPDTPTCGNGTIDFGEECDGANLGPNNCTTVPGGFTGGTLSCYNNCTFNTSDCEESCVDEAWYCIDQSSLMYCDAGEWVVADQSLLVSSCQGDYPETQYATCVDNVGYYCCGLCASIGVECGVRGGPGNECFQTWSCGTCSTGYTCNNGQCDPGTPPTCNDGNIDPGEDCDGANLDGNNCTTVPGSFTGGTLSCSNCTFDTSGCTFCGDGTCNGNENNASCPADCGGTCTEIWSCTSWSPSICPCTNQRTRTCTDANNCGTTVNKPAETQSCNHCGNGSCDCSETTASCPADCSSTICTDDSYEDNDSISSATTGAFGENTTYPGLRVCPSDDDYYGIYLHSGEQITISIMFADSEGDINLRLLDAGESTVVVSWSGTDDEEVTYTCTTSGWYYARVYLWADAGSVLGNTYSYWFDIVPATCTESWSCTGWSPSTCPCSNQRTRTCTDSNNCGTTVSKPSETQSCNHCGNGSCDCGEDSSSCSTDCPSCSHECLDLGAVVCTNSWETVECGQWDADWCLEWGNNTPCGSGWWCGPGPSTDDVCCTAEHDYWDNENQSSAVNWGSTTDGSGTIFSHEAVLYPDGDEDWYSIAVTDTWSGDLCVDVAIYDLPYDYDLCVTYVCADNSAPTVGTSTLCPTFRGSDVGGGTVCATGTGTSDRVTFSPNCSWTTDESGTAYIRVYSGSWSGGGYSCNDSYLLDATF